MVKVTVVRVGLPEENNFIRGRGIGIKMKTISSLIIIIAALLIVTGCSEKKLEPVDVNWTEWKEIEATFPLGGSKPIFLYISQNACQWCDQMDSTIFVRPEIAHHLNNEYINININVDEDLPVTIGGKVFNYQELFNLLSMREIPAYYFFDTTGLPIGVLNSAMHVNTFKRLLIYVKNRHFGRTRWEDFMKLPEAEIDTIWGIF